MSLKSLERDGLAHRRAIATVPVTVGYSITELGRTLIDTVDAPHLWAETLIEDVLTAQASYDGRSPSRRWMTLLDLPAKEQPVRRSGHSHRIQFWE